MSHDIDPKLVVQILNFLLSVYNTLRSRSKSPGKQDKEDPTAGPKIPNSEKLKELIAEVERSPEQSISAAIDKKFPPSEARQVKEDFAAYAILASPPDFADYDFASLIQKYVKGMQAIALKADLFRLRGKEVH